jgi:hypothetical protein
LRASLAGSAKAAAINRTMAMELEAIERVHPWLGPGAKREIAYN